MKKIILPFMFVMLGFTTLMAFTISEGKLIKETAQVGAPQVDAPPAVTPPADSQPGVIPNSVDIIWKDSYGNNIGYTSATSSGQAQFRGPHTSNNYAIGNPSTGFRIPTANIWNEIEEEGDGSSCSKSINQATNTRVELGRYRGWWLDAYGKWHAFPTVTTQGGSQHPPGDSGLVAGTRGCYDQYFVNERKKFNSYYLISPNSSNWRWSANTFIKVKPQHYYRFHGWANQKMFFDSDYQAKAIFIQQYARLVIEDKNKPDDRHLARYLIHLGSDRKEKDGTQLWDIGISRFKRVTNDWQPFNLFLGPQTKEEIEANPPPFVSTP